MNREITESVEDTGLQANGTSARWDVAVNECLDRDEWSLEIESSATYLAFQLRDLSVIRAALDFLRHGPRRTPNSNGSENTNEANTFVFGRFAEASVSLIWDNEDFVRCFLVIGPSGHSTLRLSFDAEDVRMLSESLEQVVDDLPIPEKQNSILHSPNLPDDQTSVK